MWLLFRNRAWLLTFFIASVPLYAEQRKYVVGTTLNLTAGATNGLTSAIIAPNQPLFFSYGAFPTITVASTGARSLVDASYSYGFNGSKSQQSYKQHSQAALINFSAPLTPQWKISVGESFQETSDASTFNALRGVTADLTSPFVFYPVAAQILSRTNEARVLVDYRFTDRSSLALNVSHNLRTYDTRTTVQSPLSQALLNQQNIAGTITYNWLASRREAWSAGYTSSYFSFKNFDNARSDEVHAGYANEIRPNLKFNLTVGLTNSKSQLAGGHIGYNTSANLQKIIQTNAFTLYYTQTSGQTSGLGSVSDTRSAGLSWNHRTRTLSEFVDISWFDTRPILGNSFSTSSFSATANVGMPLSRRWSLQGGGQYQRYDSKSAFGFNQKRLFVSLRYTDPALWTFFR